MKYLLDTNVVSDFFRELEPVFTRLKAAGKDNICFSSLTRMEIEYGFARNGAALRKLGDRWHRFASEVKEIPFDAPCANATGRIRAQLAAIGQPIGPYDVQIAGTALAHGLVMVTANTAEFERVNPMRLENWRKPENL
jgi:tRNA(fMet)-specific endonuclease VapC